VAASTGLLRRHDGARRLFVGLLLLGIAWNIGVTVFQQVFLVQSMAFAGMHEVPDEMHAQMQQMLVFFRVFGIGMAVVMSALLGWIAWRLCTPVVAAEFRRAG